MPRKTAPKPPPSPIDVSIENVGGIRQAKLILVPGVNEFRGANGAGKSSAIRAISRAFGADVPLEVRDGASEGRISAPGVVIAIKRTVRTTGEAEVEIAEGGPLATLIDPGLKDTDAAAKARLRAVVEMLRPEVTEQSLRILAGDERVVERVIQELAEGGIRTPLEAVERVRLTGHEFALDMERTAAEQLAAYESAARRHAAALERAGGRQALVAQSVAMTEAAERAAAEKLGIARAERRARVDLETRQAAARKAVGETPDPTRYDQDIELRADALSAAENEIRGLEQQIALLRERMAGIRADWKHLVEQRAAETKRLEEHRALVALLEQPVHGPSEEEVAALEAAATAAQELRRRAALSAEVHQLDDEASLARSLYDQANARAEMLRGLATTVYDRLAVIPGILGNAGRLTISGGRLHLQDGDRLLDFENRLSEGQRIDAALELAVIAYEGKVVHLGGACWNALDPRHKAKLATRAAELGLYLITERPTEGDLELAHLGSLATAEPALAAAGGGR